MFEILFVFLLNGETVGAVKSATYEKAINVLSQGINSGVLYDQIFATTDTCSEQWKAYEENRIPVVQITDRVVSPKWRE